MKPLHFFDRIQTLVLLLVLISLIPREEVYALDAVRSIGTNKESRILSRDLSFSSQVKEENVIYEIHDEFDLYGKIITIPPGSVLKFEGGVILNGTLLGQHTEIWADQTKIFGKRLVIDGTWDISESYPEWFGAIGDGIQDDSYAFSSIAKTPFVVIKFRAGADYIVSQTIEFSHAVTIDGNYSKLRFVGSSGFDGLVIKPSVLMNEIANVGIIKANKNTFEISVNKQDGISEGDMLLLVDDKDYSWSSERPYYKAGDIFEVSGLDGGMIKVTERITQDYSSTYLRLFKLNMLRASICNLEIIGSYEEHTHKKTKTPLVLACCKDVIINNIKVSGSNFAHILTELCYNVNISNIYCLEKSSDSKMSLNYGISIGTSKNVTISHCHITTTRHAIDCGGGHITPYVIPCRYVIVTDCILNSFSNVPCMSSHANCQFMTVSNCHLKNGVGLGCSDFILSSNQIEAFRSPRCISISQQVYQRGEICNNILNYDLKSIPSYSGGIVIANNINTKNPADIKISGNHFHSTGLASYNRRGGIMILGDYDYISGSAIYVSDNTFSDDNQTVSVKGGCSSLRLVFQNNLNLSLSLSSISEAYIYGNTIKDCTVAGSGRYEFKNNTIGKSLFFNNDAASVRILNNVFRVSEDIDGYLNVKKVSTAIIENNSFIQENNIRISKDSPVIFVEAENAVVRRNMYMLKDANQKNNIIKATNLILLEDDTD